jgi:NDP-sugar pyrophosphorylase family protein
VICIRAIVLAGGFGTRLRPLTFVRPKHMLPIVDKPMLEHIVDYIFSFKEIDEIIISVGYTEEFKMIEDYFNSRKFRGKVMLIKEPKRMGGVGAIKYVLDNFMINEPFVLYLGDIITDFNLKKMIDFHKKNPGAIATIGLIETHEPWKFGIAEMDGSSIKNFVEKPPIGTEPGNRASTGIYVMDPKIKDILTYEFLDSTGMLFPLLLKNGHKVNGLLQKKVFWVDVGRPASYIEATAYVLRKYDKENWVEPGVTIGEGTKLEGPVVIYKNTKIGKNCVIRNSIIFDGCDIGNGCSIINSIIDEGCKIGNDIHISTTLGKGSIIENGQDIEIERKGS